MKRSGIITLLTDFGLGDPFAGVMRGVILGRFPRARIVDLCHGIAPQSVEEGAFWLERSFRWFPKGTVHVAVVDPGVGTKRAIVAVKAEGHVFLAPDNGLLGPVLEASQGARVHRVELELLELGREVSATFHGRDIFAPLAADLARGRLRLRDLGSRVALESLDPSALPRPIAADDRVQGVVATVDRYGNLITNIPGALVRGSVEIASYKLRLRRTYGDAAPGEIIALVGSFDRLEIACGLGNAKEALGVGLGEPVTVVAEAAPHEASAGGIG